MTAPLTASRKPWPDDFPDVVIHTNVATRDSHDGYAAAKGGDANWAGGYVEEQGGSVIAITALTESTDAHRIALRPHTLNMLREQHGKDLDDLWRHQFGYGIDCLTDVEAQILCRQPSVAAIEDFLAQAAIEARGRGLEPAVESRP